MSISEGGNGVCEVQNMALPDKDHTYPRLSLLNSKMMIIICFLWLWGSSELAHVKYLEPGTWVQFTSAIIIPWTWKGREITLCSKLGVICSGDLLVGNCLSTFTLERTLTLLLTLHHKWHKMFMRGNFFKCPPGSHNFTISEIAHAFSAQAVPGA